MEINGDKTSRVLVTGANGFIGSGLCAALAEAGYAVRATVRAQGNDDAGNPAVEHIATGPIETVTDWAPALEGIDAVVHLAAMPDVDDDAGAELLQRLDAVNVAATTALARAAADNGVRRFIFLSSIKANGETTDGRSPFTHGDTPRPGSAYGRSKLAAENALRVIAARADMELVIIRPCLVYGRQPRGNMEKLLLLIRGGFPLPFGSIENRRSMLALENLCSLILRCLSHPGAKGQVFLAADDGAISTRDLAVTLSESMGLKPRLLPVPLFALRLAAAIFRKTPEIRRLTSSLLVDTGHTKTALDWQPVVTRDAALEAMVDNFVDSDGSG